MKKVFFLVLFLLIMPLVLGVSTQITIKAPADNNVTINVIKTQDDLLLKMYQVVTSSAGEAAVIHESDFSGSIYLSVMARKNGRLYSYNETSLIYISPSFYSGNAITVDYLRNPEPAPQAAPNATIENTTPAAAEQALVSETPVSSQEETSTSATGSSIIESIPLKTIGRYLAYIIGAIIIFGILALLVIKVAIPYFNNPVRRAEFSDYDSIDLKDKNVGQELQKAEAKLKEVQAEIDKIKNKRNEVKEAELRFQQAKRELERVKGKI